MKISIIGMGWFGKALGLELKSHYEISGTTRTDEKIRVLNQQGLLAEKLTLSDLPSDEILTADVIVLNIPPFVDQLSWFKSWNWNKNSHIIFISSTSVYGNTGTVDETTIPLPESDNGRILLEVEHWIKSFPAYTIIRFGGLIGEDRHPGNVLSGRSNIIGGNLPVNLIHLEDCIGFTKLVIEKKMINETFNLVDPEHPSRRQYYQDHCQKNNLPLPEFTDSDENGKIISHSKVAKFYNLVGRLA
jgi:nucleoside-diphosphate-sugar epimerase